MQPPPCSKVGTVKLAFRVAAETFSTGKDRTNAANIDVIFFHGITFAVWFKFQKYKTITTVLDKIITSDTIANDLTFFVNFRFFKSTLSAQNNFFCTV